MLNRWMVISQRLSSPLVISVETAIPGDSEDIQSGIVCWRMVCAWWILWIPTPPRPMVGAPCALECQKKLGKWQVSKENDLIWMIWIFRFKLFLRGLVIACDGTLAPNRCQGRCSCRVRSTAQAAVAVAVTVGSFSDPEAARDDKKMKLGQSERGLYIGWSMTGWMGFHGISLVWQRPLRDCSLQPLIYYSCVSQFEPALEFFVIYIYIFHQFLVDHLSFDPHTPGLWWFGTFAGAFYVSRFPELPRGALDGWDMADKTKTNQP